MGADEWCWDGTLREWSATLNNFLPIITRAIQESEQFNLAIEANRNDEQALGIRLAEENTSGGGNATGRINNR
jgi:hypothetical protein